MKIAQIAVTLVDHMGSDLSVVNAARVSFDKVSYLVEDPRNPDFPNILSEKDTKLIKYLAKHKHTSPFNHCFVTFRVKAPVFVARQLVKHKFMPWNEVSRRYVDSEPEFFFPEYWRAKADNVKQGSQDDAVVDNNHVEVWAEIITKRCLEEYEDFLAAGVCAEQARMVLPQNTMTEWIWSGSLGAVAEMCRLRLAPYTQKETREVAQKISDEMSKLYPVSWAALMET